VASGKLEVNARAAVLVRGRTTALPIAPAEASNNDLRVIRRALIVVYDTTRMARVARQFVRIHSVGTQNIAKRFLTTS
jgi:hypothetical protein